MKIIIYQENNPTFRVDDSKKVYDKKKYHKVWEEDVLESLYFGKDKETLELLFERFNIQDKPEDYTGHSMSVGDIVEIDNNVYVCASFGWNKVEWDKEIKDIFTPDNTEWELSYDEYGRIERNLVYTGDMAELAEETGISEDELYEMLGNYEDDSKDLIESQREIDEARKGQY